LPGDDPARLARVCSNQYSITPHRTYLELRDRNATLDQLAAFNMQSFGCVSAGTSSTCSARSSAVSTSQPSVSPPRWGGCSRQATIARDAPPAVVLSHRRWTRDFAAAQDVVGRTIAINDVSFTVVGMAPRRFSGVMAPLAGELWVPLATDVLRRPDLDQATRLDTSSYQLIAAGALLVARFLTTLLYGVSPTDPLTFAAVMALLGVVAGIAALLPAAAASHVDPLRALRAD
jgi:hypothetical protein